MSRDLLIANAQQPMQLLTYNPKYIYLAGPIAGCTKAGANDWRRHSQEELNKLGMIGISPLRCEPIIGERYGLGGTDPKFGTARAIGSKNLLDVQTCDLTLAYLPAWAEYDADRDSLGTIIEIAWAKAMGKPTIIVSTDPYIQAHPVVNACAGWMLDDLADAFVTIDGIFGDYVHGVRG